MPLQWREQLSVANDTIDNDHKYLIEVINLIEKMLNVKDRAGLVKALNGLAQFSVVHFDREEKIAKAAGYDNSEHLNNSHKALLVRLRQKREEFDAAGAEWSQERADQFLGFLRDWVIGHVIKEDLLLKPALQRLSPAFAPG